MESNIRVRIRTLASFRLGLALDGTCDTRQMCRLLPTIGAEELEAAAAELIFGIAARHPAEDQVAELLCMECPSARVDGLKLETHGF